MTQDSTTTARTFAAEIVTQMTDDDILDYSRDAWLEGVSLAMTGFEDYDEDDVLDELDDLVEAMPRYTTWGSVRGCCGHAHKTQESAQACASKDHRACRSLGGGAYSDRSVRVIARRSQLDDPQPGRPLAADYD